jgi:hypothetical protein
VPIVENQGEESMTRRLLLPVLVAGAMTGCATLRAVTDRGPTESEQRLEQGLTALKAGEYESAYEHLLWVAGNHEAEAVGRQALLALTAAELDPRNPNRRLGVAAGLAARYLRGEAPGGWTEPVAESIYLIALELGALEERVAQAEAERLAAERRARTGGSAQASPPRALPTLPGRTVPDRIRDVEAERDRLRQRVTQLETRLARSEQELERVRRTLRP